MIGKSIRRKEDGRLITGQGQYFEDIQLPGMLHVGFIRSVHAHAAVRSINSKAALKVPGVVAVLTVDDYEEFQGIVPELMEAGTLVNPYCDFNRTPPHPILPRVVKYVGEPVVVVVAETPYAAADAMDAVEIDYDVLPACADWEQAYNAPKSAVHEGYDSVVAHLKHEIGNVDEAFSTAEIVFEERHEMQSVKSIAMEGRGMTAAWDEITQTLNLWSTCQHPYMLRDFIAGVLKISTEQVRVRARDIGGGFGLKGGPLHSEDAIIPVLAYKYRRPMRWAETRSEHMVSSHQSGYQVHDVRVAADRDGTIRAVDIKIYKDVGAYNHFEMVCPTNTVNHMPLQYRVPSIRAEAWSIATHRTPATPYRGAGRIEASFTMDRILDRIARETGLDPLAVREKNIIPKEAMPFETGLTYRDGIPIRYEGTDFPLMLKTAIEKIDYHGWRSLQAKARVDGRHIGIGISGYMEAGGVGPCEGARIIVEESGRVNVHIGVNAQGQSHETTFAQICAEHLSASFADVVVMGGDTALMPTGFGTVASRVGVNTGNAVYLAAVAMKKKIVALAAAILKCQDQDIAIEDSIVSGPGGKQLTFGELAHHAKRHPVMKTLGGPTLTATEYFYPRTITWSSGFHIAVVELDIRNGDLKVLKYVVTHDCGVPLNPMVVDGQVYGGFAQGLGIALGEEVVYDNEGQVLSGSLMDYYVPRAIDMPEIDVHHFVFPTEENPLGIRAVGESGPISVPAVFTAAIEDAIHGRRRITTIPVTRRAVMSFIKEAVDV